jgi:hypothetical protein
MSELSITKSYNEWSNSTDTNIERLMDDAAYSSAHPDDTLVIAGPPRINQNSTGTSSGVYGDLAAVGMLQNISVNQQKPFQPMMAIGSSRSFFVGGKAQGSAQVQRLFMNTDNLLRRLYTNALDTASISPDQQKIVENPPRSEQNPNYMINLDSEYFLIPFGLGVLFHNKSRGGIGGFYLELCVIPNFTIAVQSGQSMIMEGVSLFFDRVVPLPVNTTDNTLITAYSKIVKSSTTGGNPSVPRTSDG